MQFRSRVPLFKNFPTAADAQHELVISQAKVLGNAHPARRKPQRHDNRAKPDICNCATDRDRASVNLNQRLDISAILAPNNERRLETSRAPNLAPDLVTDHVADHVPDLAPDLEADHVPDLAPDLVADHVADLVPDLVPGHAPDLVPDLVPE